MNYYSGLRPEIYHIYKNCAEGNNIAARNLREGKPPQAKLCESCAKLQMEEKGIPGMPEPTSSTKVSG